MEDDAETSNIAAFRCYSQIIDYIKDLLRFVSDIWHNYEPVLIVAL